MENWSPLSKRDSGDDGQGGPYEGVPPWMQNSLLDWLRPVWHGEQQRANGNIYVTHKVIWVELFRRMERALRNPKLAHVSLEYSTFWNSFRRLLKDDDALCLDVVDFVVGLKRQGVNPKALETLLSESGSVWTVSKGEPARLERRVDPIVRSAAVAAMEVEDRPGQYLAAAWSALYGRSPSAGEGYRNAVRAVESAAKPIVSPKDSDATLGKMRAALRDKPEKWTMVLQKAGHENPVGVVASMMGLLYGSDHARHGTDDEEAPLDVSIEEARAALQLAIVLVQWLREGDLAVA